MESQASSKFRFLTVDGAPLSAPLEWELCWIELVNPPHDWMHLKLVRNEVVLELFQRVLNGKVRLLAQWPRSNPGHYRLELIVPENTPVSSIVTVEPRKISPGAFRKMLADMTQRLPAAIGLGLQRAGALSGITVLPPQENTLEEEYVRLHRAVKGTPSRIGLVEILTQLANDPHKVLSGTEMWVKIDQARRPDPARLPQAVMRGGLWDREKRPTHVLDRRVEHTTDVYENQIVLVYTRLVQHRLRRLAETLGQPGHQKNLKRSVEQLSEALAQARHLARFLDEVRLPSTLPRQPTMVLLKRPPYRAALEGYLELYRSIGIRLDEPALEAPLENVPRLYQVWNTLVLLGIALDVGHQAGYQVKTQSILYRDANDWYVRLLRNGHSALGMKHLKTGRVVKLIPERTYSRQNKASSSVLKSLSFSQRPDLAVEVHESNGSREVYLFDPKYKFDSEVWVQDSVGRPKKEDVDKMHAYRDAIRDTKGRHVVRLATILYPGTSIQYGAGVRAVHSNPSEIESLEKELRKLFMRIFEEA